MMACVPFAITSNHDREPLSTQIDSGGEPKCRQAQHPVSWSRPAPAPPSYPCCILKFLIDVCLTWLCQRGSFLWRNQIFPSSASTTSKVRYCQTTWLLLCVCRSVWYHCHPRHRGKLVKHSLHWSEAHFTGARAESNLSYPPYLNPWHFVYIQAIGLRRGIPGFRFGF